MNLWWPPFDHIPTILPSGWTLRTNMTFLAGSVVAISEVDGDVDLLAALPEAAVAEESGGSSRSIWILDPHRPRPEHLLDAARRHGAHPVGIFEGMGFQRDGVAALIASALSMSISTRSESSG